VIKIIPCSSDSGVVDVLQVVWREEEAAPGSGFSRKTGLKTVYPFRTSYGEKVGEL
jgi:hypothetical protein